MCDCEWSCELSWLMWVSLLNVNVLVFLNLSSDTWWHNFFDSIVDWAKNNLFLRPKSYILCKKMDVSVANGWSLSHFGGNLRTKVLCKSLVWQFAWKETKKTILAGTKLFSFLFWFLILAGTKLFSSRVVSKGMFQNPCHSYIASVRFVCVAGNLVLYLARKLFDKMRNIVLCCGSNVWLKATS